jgi:hypothetical protein
MRRAAWLAGTAAIVAVSALVATAQVGGKPVSGGNPTPGTPQPEPPNLSDRITLTGCLQPAPRRAASPGTSDANTPSDTRFVLSTAQRVDRVPPGTGGSARATSSSSRSYRLEGLDSQFSPFVNARVEISGEVKPFSTDTPPTVLVEFVQRTAATCQ